MSKLEIRYQKRQEFEHLSKTIFHDSLESVQITI